MTPTHFRILLRFWTMNIARETQYRANLISVFVVGILEAILTILPLLLLFSFTDSLRGWSMGESIALSGLFRMAFALYMMLAGNGVASLSEDIEEGKLDMLLVRPVSPQLVVTFRYFSLPQVNNLAIGVLLLVIGLAKSDLMFSLSGVTQAAALFLCGTVLIGCAISAGSYLAFRVTTVSDLPWLLHDIMDMGRYPITFYPKGVRFFLTAIMPVAFVTTFPIDALRGNTSWGIVVLAVMFSIVALLGLRWWWDDNVKRYSSAGS